MSNSLHFGVSIGIDRYPEFNDLRFARKDAKAFHDWLLSPNGGDVPESNAKLVIAEDEEMPDGIERKEGVPSQAQILECIKEFIDSIEDKLSDDILAWEASRFYLFVSGHGIAFSGSTAALLAANAGATDPGYHVDSGELRDFLQETQPFREVLIFADCCRERVPYAKTSILPWLERPIQRGTVKYFLACGAEYGGLAYEPSADPDLNRGHFSKALLEGLEGAALKEGENSITTSGLKNYLEWRVKEIAEQNGVDQWAYPDEGGGEIILRETNAARVLHTVTIHFPEGFQGTAVVQNGSLETVATEEILTSEWVLGLPKGLYLVADSLGAHQFENEGQFKVIGEELVIHV